MYKEFIIIIIVLTIVIGLDILTGNYTKDSVLEISTELEELKGNILNKEYNEANQKMDSISKKWDERYEILAYYLEHDELEKVETQITLLRADLLVKEYNTCIEDIETSKYILNHIEDKEKLDIISIF